MKILITSLLLLGLFRLANAQTPVSNAGPDDSVCILSYTLQAVPSIGIGTWTTISGPGGVTFSNVNSATSIMTVPIGGSYTLVWTENNSGLIDADTVIISLHIIPTSTFTASTINCYNDISVIVYTGNTSVSATYNWNFNGGIAYPGTGSGPHAVTWSSAGVNQVSLSVSQNGCTSPVTTINIINPSAILATLSSTGLNCYESYDGALILSISGGTLPYTYLWNNGAITEDQSGLSAGFYSVTVTDNNSCTLTMGLPVWEPDQIILSATSNSPVCVGNPLELYSSVIGGVSPYNYAWIGPAGFNSILQNPTINAFATIFAGQYTVLVTDANSCTTIDTVNIYDCSIIPNCSAQFTIEPDTLPHYYNVISNAIGVNPLMYSWNWGDGTYSNAAYPTHTYSVAGTYTICLTIIDDIGCSSMYCDSSYFQKSQNDVIYVHVIPYGSIGINENKLSNQIKIYPNPTNGKFTITPTDNYEFIEVFNIIGEKINYQISYNNNVTEIDVTMIPKGIYFVKVDNGEQVLIEKVVLN